MLLADLGPSEIHAALTGLLGLFVALLIFNGKSALGRIDKLEAEKQELKVKVALLEATAPEHATRIGTLENVVPELKVAVGAIQTDLRRVVAWVDLQASPDRHRRSSDRKDEA